MTPSAHSKFAKEISSRKLIILAIVVTLAGLGGGCKNQPPSETGPTPVLSGPPNTNYPMPPFSARADVGWTLVDGKHATMADYQGKVLVLDFYATWCIPCRESIPKLMALQRNEGPAGLQVVGLNVGGPDDRIKVADFAKELGIQYSLGFPDKSMTDLFLSDNQTIPQTFVFDREGQLVKRFIGYETSTGAELEQLVQSETAKKPPRAMSPGEAHE